MKKHKALINYKKINLLNNKFLNQIYNNDKLSFKHFFN